MLIFHYKEHPLMSLLKIFGAVSENRETNKYALPTTKRVRNVTAGVS